MHRVRRDLEVVEPPDMTPQGPEWMQDLDQELQAFARQVYSLWRLLYRQVSAGAYNTI